MKLKTHSDKIGRFFNCNCYYCKERTYVGIINNGLYIEIPKNASTLIKDRYVIGKCDFRLNEHNVHNFDKCLIVLRHPIQRFSSLISHYFIDGLRKKYGKMWVEKNKLEDKSDIIIDFILDNFEKLKDIHEPHHFNSQVSFIPKLVLDVNVHFIDINDVNTYFKINTVTNSSNSFNVNFTKSQKNKIKNIYSYDYEFYKNNIL